MELIQTRVRLAELVATLSLGTDLGLGQPMEHIVRQCHIALRFSDVLKLPESERVVVYYSGLLCWVCCYIDAYEQAKWFGDDIALKADTYSDEGSLWFLISHVGAGKPLVERAMTGLELIGGGLRTIHDMLKNHWLAAEALTVRLGLGDDVRSCVQQSFERWDGKFTPLGLKGEDILLTSRLLQLTDVAEVFYRIGGRDAAVSVARRRSGSQFDPRLVEVFCDHASELLDDLGESGGWEAVIAGEPALSKWLSREQFESSLEAIGDFTDLKSPYTIGHSRSVADLAAAAAKIYGLPQPAIELIRQAGLVHDIGRLGVSNSIWDKRGPLTQAEMERVRLHPYLSERMLAFSPSLAPLGAVAVLHHERLDGSGYPRGLSGDAISPHGRILAAADVYHALTELRPHRPARSPEDAADIVRAEVTAGGLEGAAVDAVLQAAGHRVRLRKEWPSGLTSREVEVLRLVARGLSNREIARELVISPKTAGNHVDHIYTRIGVSNRARASLFAMQHGLLADEYSVS